MKKSRMILIGIALIAFLAMALIYAQQSTLETYDYTVIKTVDDVEIRQYEEANFISYTMAGNSFSESSGRGFRVLAGYIFGDNDANKKIAMTAPVSMEFDDSITMRFMVPSDFELSDLPNPNDKNIKFETLPGEKMAAIRFGGWASDSKIKKYKAELRSILDKSDIEYTEPFIYFGYDSPYNLINRRNEILVKVKY